MKSVLVLAAVSAFSGCSSILEDPTQQIIVETEPPGATCRLLRSGTATGQVSPTPGALVVGKSTYDIVIICDKSEYQQTSYVNGADVAAASVASAVLFGATGWAIDSTTGTANKYESRVTIRLVPISGPHPGPDQPPSNR